MSSTPPASAPDRDIRPVVATGYSGSRSVWLFGGGLALAAIALFVALDSRREQLVAPATAIPASPSGATISAPPELVVPYGPGDEYAYREDWPQFAPPIAAPVRGSPAYGPAPASQVTVREVVRTVPAPVTGDAGSIAGRAAISSAPSVVYDARIPASRGDGQTANALSPEADAGRVRAGRLSNPSSTVPQGTVIPAVLETALDSTRAGAVRGIVSRDVRGFDGTRILIPRGSRLYGEYNAELTAGQNRALIRWKRLVRPDGALIALDSPASDPLGRAGVKGKVDSHFLERFGGAILQSVLDVGVGLATRKVDNTVVVGLPGSTQSITGASATNQVQRTLRVRQGTSVSVFVARDLDFSSVE